MHFWFYNWFVHPRRTSKEKISEIAIFRAVCLSVRSCGEVASVPRPGEPHLLNCRCMQVTSISFNLQFFSHFERFERTNKPLLSLCHFSAEQFVLAFPFVICWARCFSAVVFLSCCLFPDFTSHKGKLFVYLDVHSIGWKGNFAD